MAIGQTYLESVRLYMRLTAQTFDSELTDLINAARADMVLGGVLEDRASDESDPLVLRAVATYVKAEFGLDNDDSEKYRAAYSELKTRLMLADAYITEEEV